MCVPVAMGSYANTHIGILLGNSSRRPHSPNLLLTHLVTIMRPGCGAYPCAGHNNVQGRKDDYGASQTHIPEQVLPDSAIRGTLRERKLGVSFPLNRLRRGM